MRMKYAKNDFTNDSLPLNRRKQFFAIFKTEWKTLLLIGVFFLIPLLFFIALEVLRTITFSNINAYIGTELEAKMPVMRFWTNIIFNAGLIIPFIGFSIIFAGFSKVLQRLIYGEGLLFKGDFIYGLKHNFKQIFFLTLFYYFFNLLISFGTETLTLISGNISTIMSGILIVVFRFLISPIIFIACTLSVTYKMKMGTLLSNGFKILFGFLLMPLLYGAIVFGLQYLNLIPSLLAIILIQLFITTVLLPIFTLIWHLYLTSIFDKHINEENYPQIYLKGLRDYKYQKGEKTL